MEAAVAKRFLAPCYQATQGTQGTQDTQGHARVPEEGRFILFSEP